MQSFCTKGGVGITNLQSSSSSKKCQHLDSKIYGGCFGLEVSDVAPCREGICVLIVFAMMWSLYTKCLSASGFDTKALEK